MNRETVEIFARLNADFYQANHESFDRSRQTAWPGWERIVTQFALARTIETIRLLDVACGNMRFEKYLLEAMPGTELQATCVDSCDSLAVSLDGCVYRHSDIVEELLESESPSSRWGRDFDAVVSFGFFHHVPSHELRSRLLDSLVETALPGAIVAVSLWRFASDDKMRKKAELTTHEASSALSLPPDFEDGDYLLGWNDVAGAYRYCHSFDDPEIETLVESVASRTVLLDRFRADGRTGEMNEYLVFRRL